MMIDLEQLVAAMPGNVYWLDKHNVYQGCNDLQAAFFGLSSRLDVIGKKNGNFLNPKTAEIVDRNNLEVIQSGVPRVFEEVVTLSDGSQIVTLSHKKPLFDDKGFVIGLIGISTDVTEQCKYETQLKKERDESNSTLNNIIANLPGHVYWQDRNHIFLGCNELQARSAGLKSSKEIVGKTNDDMPWSDQAEALNKINDQVMLTGEEYSVEEFGKLSDGKDSAFLSKKVPLRNDNGDTIGILGISFDITERKKMERELLEAKEAAEEANNAKTQFLEEMRHDIRTPLSGIVGIAELLNAIEDKSKAGEYTKWLLASSQELMKFLNDVLESVTSSSGNIPVSIKRFNLYETIERVVILHQAKAIEKGLALNFHFDKNIPFFLMSDPTRIYRIILELLSNALKFTEKGEVNVRVILSQTTDRDIVVQLEIQDTGPGIPKDKQHDLFTSFNRLSPSYSGIYQGSGLGLSIAKTFAEDLGGELHVQSDGRSGSQFICLLPLREALLQVMPALDAVEEDASMFGLPLRKIV